MQISHVSLDPYNAFVVVASEFRLNKETRQHEKVFGYVVRTMRAGNNPGRMEFNCLAREASENEGFQGRERIFATYEEAEQVALAYSQVENDDNVESVRWDNLKCEWDVTYAKSTSYDSDREDFHADL